MPFSFVSYVLSNWIAGTGTPFFHFPPNFKAPQAGLLTIKFLLKMHLGKFCASNINCLFVITKVSHRKKLEFASDNLLNVREVNISGVNILHKRCKHLSKV